MNGWSHDFVTTDRGRRLKLARDVPASADQAWTLMSRVEHWVDWGPFLTGVRYPHDRVREETTGQVQLFGLFWVPFRIDRVEEFFWSWTVLGMTPPSDGHRVEPLGDRRCRISFEVPLWGVPYAPVCWGALKAMETILARP